MRVAGQGPTICVMASQNNSRRWIILVFVALGVVAAATLPRSGSDDVKPESEPTEAREASPKRALPPDPQLDGERSVAAIRRTNFAAWLDEHVARGDR